MIAQPSPQRRLFHRIRFPLAEQPRWMVGEATFTVVDLSEASCQLKRLGPALAETQQTLRGNLQFADGDKVWIEGHPVRQDADGIVVQFTKGVTLKKMIALQRSLFQKYPMLRHSEM